MGNGRGLGGLIALLGLAFLLSREEKVTNGIIPTFPTVTFPTITIPEILAPITEVKPRRWHRKVIETKIEVLKEEVQELELEVETPILPHKVFIAKKVAVDPTFEMPIFPIYPQVTPARPRIDPKIEHYEEALAEKYPEELEAT
ncbi:unnamed protein product, partial [marine sediment metagenome]